ncbi:MAG: F0F1 ATP synthase subunit I [Alphaproteobacteria bacterium]|nr:F0F1 ATP synthase subunit I [Alphaproteobacteria bacterium]
MGEPSEPEPLRELGARIAKVRETAGLAKPPPEREQAQAASGMAMAMRLAIELVVAVVVSAGLGWVFDRWLGTGPWLMLGMLVLGFAAGINNAVRAALRMDRQTAERLAAERRDGQAR